MLTSTLLGKVCLQGHEKYEQESVVGNLENIYI